MFHELFLSLRRLGITMLVYYVMAVNKRFLMIENKGVCVCTSTYDKIKHPPVTVSPWIQTAQWRYVG